MDLPSANSKRYDVALSFAGEDRDYVRQVAQFLRAQSVRVFFDEAEQTDLWGKDLVEALARVYSEESHFVVVFISKSYAEKEWTRHELRSSLSAAIRHRREYILPVRFDQTQLEGLLNSVSYLSISQIPPIDLGRRIVTKLRSYGLLAEEASSLEFAPGIRVWKLSRAALTVGPLSGPGARLGTWNSGHPLMYTASSQSHAALEMLVNLSNDELSIPLVFSEIIIPPTVSMSSLYSSSLPSDWRSNTDKTRALGDSWFASKITCVLSVPSTMISEERSFLLNPKHADYPRIKVVSQHPYRFDPSLP